MEAQEANVVDLPETRETEKTESDNYETEKTENDNFDALEQSESTETPTETVSSGSEDTLTATESIHDFSDGEVDDWDEKFFTDEIYSDYMEEINVESGDEDESEAEKKKEQDSDIPEAPENITQSSLVQSCQDRTTSEKSRLESVSEESKLMPPPKNDPRIIESKNAGKLLEGPSGSSHKQNISQADEKTAQEKRTSTTSEGYPQMKDWAALFATLMINQNISQAKMVPGASIRLTDFPSVPVSVRDEPHTRKIRSWLTKRKPKSKTEQPSPALPGTHTASNISPIQTEKKTAPVQSIAGVPKKQKQPLPVLPREEDQKLVSASLKKETTAQVESVAARVSKKVEQPLLVLPEEEDLKLILASSEEETAAQVELLAEVSKPLEQLSKDLSPKKDPKFTSLTLSEEDAPDKSDGEISEKLEKLSIVSPPKEDSRLISSVLIQENIAQVESAEDASRTVTDGDLTQQRSEILENRESLELSLTAIQLTDEQTAPAELISKVTEPVEQMPLVLPVTSDDANIPSIQKDEKTAQKMSSLEACEECEKAPPVSPRTTFVAPDLSTQRTDLEQLGQVARKVEVSEETSSNEQAEQAPSVPQTQKFPEPPLPSLLQQHIEKAGSLAEALRRIGYKSSPIENMSFIPLTKLEEYYGQGSDDEMILKSIYPLTSFPEVPVSERDAPHTRIVFLPQRKSEKLTQKPVKKTKRLPPAVLKLKNDTCTAQGTTEKVTEQGEPVSVTPKVLAEAPSVVVSSKKPDSSPETSENTAHTSPAASKSTSETAQGEPVSVTPKVLAEAPSVVVSSQKPDSLPENSENTAHTSPAASKSTSETAQHQSPQKSQNIAPDSPSPPAEEEWQDFKISGEELEKDQSRDLELPQAETTVQSDVAICNEPNVVVYDGSAIPLAASLAQPIPFAPSSQVTTPSTGLYSLTEPTHDDYVLALTEKKIKVFRAFRENIPKEDYIRDLIGVQVYQWTSCPEKEQPCDKFCSSCNFCCHQFFCTCRPYNLRTLSWCKHMHAASRPAKNEEKESVVFVMEPWQMKPQLAHLRAMCYDLDNVLPNKDYFLVKEFSPLRTKVTRGNREQRCGDCDPENTCSTCDICLHVYKCVCEAFRRGELCEHCHVVGLYRKKSRDSPQKSETSKQTSSSNGISKQASNSGGTSTQALGSGGTSNMTSNSGVWI